MTKNRDFAEFYRGEIYWHVKVIALSSWWHEEVGTGTMRARVCLFDNNDPLKTYFRTQTADSEDGHGRYALPNFLRPNLAYDFLKVGETYYYYSYNTKIPVVFCGRVASFILIERSINELEKTTWRNDDDVFCRIKLINRGDSKLLRELGLQKKPFTNIFIGHLSELSL